MSPRSMHGTIVYLRSVFLEDLSCLIKKLFAFEAQDRMVDSLGLFKEEEEEEHSYNLLQQGQSSASR